MLRSLSIGRRWLASFHGCGVIPELCERLQEQGITTPTTVQAKVYITVVQIATCIDVVSYVYRV